MFEEKELRTMGWEIVFCKEQWEEVNILLKAGKYDEAEKKTLEFKNKYMDSLIEFDLLLLEAQHRKGDFYACAETYKNTNRPSLAFFSAVNKTPLVLEYCEAMLDLQGTIPMYIQLAWKGAHDCLDKVMRSNPPERSYIICIRAFKAALGINQPLFGGNEEALIKDYIKSGLNWYPESKTLLEMQSRHHTDVFICYSHKDKEVAERICSLLDLYGITYWIEREGEDFNEDIVDAIVRSDILLFISSVNSNNSRNTVKEVSVAELNNKPILPIRIDDSPYNKSMEYDLCNKRWIDFKDINSFDELGQQLNDNIRFYQNRKGLSSMVSKIGRGTEYQSFDDSHEWVDLGLPSGTLWATCNVGASRPEEYGDFFAWGETVTKAEFNWATYRHCNGGGYTMTKYVNSGAWGPRVDNLEELLPEDDAATVNWGDNWQMPSTEQFRELIDEDNTTIRWETINGVSGKLITSKANGNSIFFPAAGIRGETNAIYQRSDCICWSRSLNIYAANEADYLLLSIGHNCIHYNKRGYGLTVRPVRVLKANNM